MIADLSPAGAMEEMLAERIVSLSWRLKRAEIYQNSVIDSIIDDRMFESWETNRRAQEQAKEGDMSLIIGLAIRRDFSNSRVLDLLLQYERRIESSLYKATAELRKIKKIRQEREMVEDGRGKMDEKVEAIPPLGKAATLSETIDEERRTMDETGEKMEDRRKTRDENNFVKHPAPLESYAVKQTQSAFAKAPADKNPISDEYPLEKIQR
jgi:hypothetical protein